MVNLSTGLHMEFPIIKLSAYFITKWDSFFIKCAASVITKCDRYYKVRQFYYNVRQVLQLSKT